MNLITNMLVFVVLLSRRSSTPLSHLPTWLADVAQVLPFYAMAQIVRAALTTGIVTDPATGTAW